MSDSFVASSFSNMLESKSLLKILNLKITLKKTIGMTMILVGLMITIMNHTITMSHTTHTMTLMMMDLMMTDPMTMVITIINASK